MDKLHIDVETFSSLDVTEVGAYKYVEDPLFTILLVAVQWNDGPVEVFDLASGEDIDDETLDALTDPRVLKIAHNANFEMVTLGRHYGLRLDPAQWYCTMIGAAQLGLPMSLAGVATVLRLDQQKSLRGKQLIRYFCGPVKKPTKKDGYREINRPKDAPDMWAEFKEYNAQDVRTEAAIYDYLLKFPEQPDFERDYWHHDQQINRRGVKVDQRFVRAAIRANAKAVTEARDEIQDITGVDNPNSLPQLRKWVASRTGQDWTAIRMDKQTVADNLDGGLLDDDVARVYQLRQVASKTSVTKYARMLLYACDDSRMRGTIQYYGAYRTGRYAGRGPQPHNLKRSPDPDKVDLDKVRNAILEGRLHQLYDDVPEWVSKMVRTAIVPRKGCSLIPCDFSAIEARVTAWLANERWRLEAFEDPATDIYKLSYSKMFGVSLEDVGDKERRMGKVAELALGFGGAFGAMVTMGALRNGIPEDLIDDIVKGWRAASPNIAKLWKKVEGAAKYAIREKRTHVLHLPHCKLTFKYDRGYLYIVLPSGRFLSYYGAGVLTKDEVFGGKRNRVGSLFYYGMNDKNQWERIPTYGGSLVENIVQAIARDLLAEAMLRLEDAGVYIVMHVHDEAVAEDYDDQAADTLKLMQKLMAVNPKWAKGLPLRAVGFVTKYYRKD